MAGAGGKSKAKAAAAAGASPDIVKAARAALAARKTAVRQAAPPPAPKAPPAPPKAKAESTEPPLSAADRENPDKLSGEALRKLAHQRGIARSEAERMDDDKLRMQLRYIIHRQYAEAEE